MTDRKEYEFQYKVGTRSANIRVMDSIGPEDCYNVHIAATLHRLAVGEDLFTPIPRSIKDWIIKQNVRL